LSALVVTGVPATLSVGQSIQLAATATFLDGTTLNVTGIATWKSSNPSVAIVSNSGLLAAIGPGTVTVTATYDSVVGAQPLTVAAISVLACGDERWAVKTLSDPAASQIAITPPTSSTISELNLLTAHCSNLPDARTYQPEFQAYEVTGVITLARLEDDRDYHVVLADPNNPSMTMVTEISDPQCQGSVTSIFRQELANARTQFESIRNGRPLADLMGTVLRVRGVGFYDFSHGQTGRSANCIELHPLTNIVRIQ